MVSGSACAGFLPSILPVTRLTVAALTFRDLESEAEKLWKQFTEELKSAQDLVDLQGTPIDEIRDMEDRWVLFKEYPSGSDKKLADGEWFHYGEGRTVAFKWNPLSREMWRHVKKQTNLGTDWDGDIGWMRISDTVRYAATFTPPARCTLPAVDGNTVLLEIQEGVGATTYDQSGNDNDGAITAATWGCDCSSSAIVRDPECG